MTDYQCITCGWKGTNPRHMTDGAAHYSWWKCPKCGKEGDIYTSEFLHRIFMFHYSDFLPRYTETLQSLTKYLEVDQHFFETLLKDQGVVCLIPKPIIRELIMRAGRMRQVVLGVLGIEEVEDRTTDETTTTFVEETQEGYKIREEREEQAKALEGVIDHFGVQLGIFANFLEKGINITTLRQMIRKNSQMKKDLLKLLGKEEQLPVSEEQYNAVKELYDTQKEDALKPKTYTITGEITIEEKHEGDR